MTTKTKILKQIRSYCLDCSCGSRREVAGCEFKACPLWSFRFGRDPEPSRTRAVENLAPVGRVLSKKQQSDCDDEDEQ